MLSQDSSEVTTYILWVKHWTAILLPDVTGKGAAKISIEDQLLGGEMGIKVATALEAAIWDPEGTWIRSMGTICCQDGFRDVVAGEEPDFYPCGKPFESIDTSAGGVEPSTDIVGFGNRRAATGVAISKLSVVSNEQNFWCNGGILHNLK